MWQTEDKSQVNGGGEKPDRKVMILLPKPAPQAGSVDFVNRQPPKQMSFYFERLSSEKEGVSRKFLQAIIL